MASLSEGLFNTLPTDAVGHVFEGGMDDTGRFWAGRVDPNLSRRVALWGTNNLPLMTAANPAIINSTGANQLLNDGIFTWAATAAAGVTFTQVINFPGSTHPLGYAYLAITNPSLTSTLTVIFQNQEVFSGNGTPTTHYPEVTRVTVPINKPEGMVYYLQGWLMGDGARLVVSNTSIADSGGIVAAFKVRKF